MAKMVELPLDIQLYLLDFIFNKADLAALCRTHKDLQNVVRSRLYHTVHLQLGGVEDEPFRELLQPAHPGLKYIQHVIVDYAVVSVETAKREGHRGKPREHDPLNWWRDEISLRYDRNRAFNFIDDLLSILPTDSLRTFRWAGLLFDIPVRKWVKLYSTQANLTNIECYMISMEELGKFPKFYANKENVRTIVIYGNASKERDQIGPGELALEGFHNLDELKLRGSNGNDHNLAEDDYERRIFSVLKCNGLSSSLSTPVQISKLTLDSLNLTNITNNDYMNTMSFRSLSALTVISCKGNRAFLQALNATDCQPHTLKKLAWMFDERPSSRGGRWRDQSEEITMLNKLLNEQTRLDYLHIEVKEGTSFPNPKAILVSAKTLNHLRINSDTYNTLQTWSSKQIVNICRKCVNLRQLHLDFPFRDFHTVTLYDQRIWFNDRDLVKTLDAAVKIPGLRTLCIGNFWAPSKRDRYMIDCSSDRGSSLFKSDLRGIAEYLFRASTKRAAKASQKSGKQYYGGPKGSLEVVAGSYDPDERFWAHQQLSFMPEKTFDAKGKPKVQAVQKGRPEVKKLMDECDCLEDEWEFYRK